MKKNRLLPLTFTLAFLIFYPGALFSQWYEYNPGTPFEFGLNDVFFTDTTFGWIAGDGGRLLTTSDGGITWDENFVLGGTPDLTAVCFLDPDSGLVSTSGGAILKTSDGGADWEVIKDAGDGPLPWLFYFSEVIYAGGYNRILKGDPDGNEWNEVFNVAPYDFELSGLQLLDEQTGYFSVYVAQGMGSQYGAIGKTTDGFLTYESVTFEWNGYFRIYFLNEGQGWCSGHWENNPTGIYRTYNGGGSWSMSYNEYVKKLFFYSMQTGWATDDHTVFGFMDNEWEIQLNSVYEFKDICFVNDQKGFCIGNLYDGSTAIESRLYYTNNGGWLNTGNHPVTEQKGPMEVFPNPVEDVLIIRGISDPTQNVSWYIYSHNTYGIVLQGTLNIKDGSGYATLNVTQLKKGIYYLRFFGPSSIQTFKILKI